ncbi:MAG TPA: hypothetical protein VFR35_07880 [Actinoplanes sp.]|nr:hypothetical protein [Actinoplanes sp.]
MSYLILNDVRSEALFASALQPSDEPTAARVRAEIMLTVRQFGTRGCAARMAQQFGDSPQPAVARMRWARRVVADVFAAQPAHAQRARSWTPAERPQMAASGRTHSGMTAAA